MLKYVIIFLVFQNVDANTESAWNTLKGDCADTLREYNVFAKDLKYSTFVANCAEIEELNSQVNWEAGVNCFSLLTNAQKSHFTQFAMPGVPDVEIAVSPPNTDPLLTFSLTGAN